MMTMSKSFQAADLIGCCFMQRYQIQSQLGEGSMGFVFKAFDSRLETDVVVKVPRPEKIADAEFAERFRRESQLMVRLTNPHVVPILDVGDIDGIPFVVMNFLSGGTLKERIVEHRTAGTLLEPASINKWLNEVSRALDFVHTQNVVHRDVKPANILFDRHGNAFLSDFGLTKIIQGDHRDLNSDETAAGYVVGTPNYVAPEIVLGRSYDGRADQYSLALTIYHAMTGRPPMQGANTSATMVNQTQKQLPLLSDVRRDFPQHAAMAVDRGLRKNPAERFPTCEQFATAVLQGLQAGRLPATSPGLTSSGPSPSSASSSVTSRSGSSATTSSASSIRQGSLPPVRSDRPRSSESLKSRRPAGRTASSGRSRPNARSGSSRAQSGVSRGPAGRVPCPACKVVLPLKPDHAGRTGRCIHCKVRLEVATDLTMLTRVRAQNLDWYPEASGLPPKRKKKKSSGNSNASDASGELFLGEKVFGWEVGKTVAVVMSVLLLCILLGATVYMTVFFTSESEQDKLKNALENMERRTEHTADRLPEQ